MILQGRKNITIKWPASFLMIFWKVKKLLLSKSFNKKNNNWEIPHFEGEGWQLSKYCECDWSRRGTRGILFYSNVFMILIVLVTG